MKEIVKHIRDNKVFSPIQYGFIDRRSTTLQLLYVIDEWTEIINSAGTIDTVYMDFMKAFDKVPHVRLLQTLESYGTGDLLKRISNFLTGHKLRVRVGSATSEWSAVISGICQGSVLGPILFVIYINNLPAALKNNFTAVMYADDTKVYRRTDEQLLQEDLDALYKWAEKWQRHFHSDKCKVLSLGNRSHENKPKLLLYVLEDNATLREAHLEETVSEKYISVITDNKLSLR